MNAGKIVFQGTPDELTTRGEVAARVRAARRWSAATAVLAAARSAMAAA
jgi:hypothetical protein